MNRITKKHRDVIGLDIGVSSLKLVWLRKNGASCELLGSVVKALPKSDKSVFLNEDVKLAAIIKAAVREIECTAKKVFVCISGPVCYTRMTSVLSMPQEELKEAVKWAIKEQIPMNLDMVVVGYQLLGSTTDEGNISHARILAAAAEKRIIYVLAGVMTQAQLVLAGVTLAPFAFGVFFGNVSGPAAVLDIGSWKAELTFFDKGLPQFNRLLPGSGEDFTKAMTGTLVSDRGRLDLAYEDAESLKIEVGIPQQENITLKKNISSTQLLSMYRPALEKLIGQIKRSFDYYKFQMKMPAPDKIYLTGGGSLLKNLDGLISKELNVKVERLSVLTGLYKPDASSESAVFFDPAIAAGLAESGPADLIPQEIKLQKAHRIERSILRFIAFMAVSLLVVSYLSMKLQIYVLKRQIELGVANYRAMQEVVALKGRIDKQRALLSSIAMGESEKAVILDALSNVIPASVELDSFSCKENGGINLRGTVIGSRPEAVLIDFVKSMQQAGVFENIKIAFLQKDANQALLSRFAISCNINEAQKR